MLLGVIAALVLGGLFLFAGILEVSLIQLLVNPSDRNGSLSAIHIWVDPGPAEKLLPLASIVATWLYLSLRSCLSKPRPAN